MGDKEKSKQVYEHGMFQAFRACFSALSADGRMVVVFAHKNPDAWEALVSAIIRAGFVVDGSWPIQTEQTSRSRAISSAALSSSVWLVCKKRAATARAGWDNVVLADMRQRIRQRLRDFWDAGIRGPDFVWAATGPALEAYSLHPIVKKANEPGALLTVAEFLEQVRRLVVEFVVGRVLGSDDGDAEAAGLDPVTTYYLLHRHDFGLAPAPAGACILYALSCGVSDRALADQYDLVTGGGSEPNANPNADREGGAGDGDDDAPDDEGGAATLRLKPWSSRKRKNLGEPGARRPARAPHRPDPPPALALEGGRRRRGGRLHRRPESAPAARPGPRAPVADRAGWRRGTRPARKHQQPRRRPRRRQPRRRAAIMRAIFNAKTQRRGGAEWQRFAEEKQRRLTSVSLRFLCISAPLRQSR
jgi:putative DNA methylase